MKDIHIAVVGLGNWGKNIARCFSCTQHSRLMTICDDDPARLAAQMRLYPHARATRDLDALLTDPEIDAVALATPAPTHFALAEWILNAGKHLFVEKPLTLSPDDAERLCSLAAAQRRTLMVGHLLKYHPVVTWMKDYLDSGALGQVYYLYAQRLNLGVVRSDENAFWSLAPHDISVILYLLGAMPVTVAAHGAGYLQSDIEDVIFADLHFADGRMAHIHVSWLDPHKERRMVIVGSEQMMVFDDMQATEPLRIYHKGVVRPDVDKAQATVFVRHGNIDIPYIPSAEPLQTECQHFIDCLHTGATPRSDGIDGLRVVRVLQAVQESLRAQGQPIRVEGEHDNAAISCA